MAAHAKLSPSSAARWLTCTASVALEAGIEDKASEYAAEGTYAHALCEIEAKYAVGQITKRQLTAQKKRIYNEEFHDAEVEESALYYANYIKETVAMLKELNGEDPAVMFEQRLDLSRWVPECFGTADCVIISGHTIHVIDFKYGKGVEVSSAGNPQMQLYAAGALALFEPLYDIRTVGMTILQPRLSNKATSVMPVSDLEDWLTGVVMPKAEEALSSKGVYLPSEAACRFCKAKGECAARAEKFVELFEEEPDPGLLSLERLGEILGMTRDMKTWLGELETSATQRLLSGETIPGWKLVEAKTRRQIPDEEAAAKALREAGLSDEQIFTVKLSGITAIEKALGKKRAAEVLDGLIVKPKGGPALAPQSDKRPELHPEEAILEAFEEE